MWEIRAGQSGLRVDVPPFWSRTFFQPSDCPPSKAVPHERNHNYKHHTTSRRTCARTAKLQPVDHQESIQQDRDRSNLPPAIAPILVLLPPLLAPAPSLVCVGSEAEPDVVVEGGRVFVEVELGPGLIELVDPVPINSGSPIPQPHQKNTKV